MRRYEVISQSSTSFGALAKQHGGTVGTLGATVRRTMSHQEVMDLIGELRQISEADARWSEFTNKRGQRIERVVFEWYVCSFGIEVRCTDVLWINKGYIYS